ncbi:hypothetical protein HK102_012378, partial [Quaeritorhiza haematococci]
SRLTTDEDIVKGSVSSSVYSLYYRAYGGLVYVVLLMVGYSTNHGFAVLQDWWVKMWTGAYAEGKQVQQEQQRRTQQQQVQEEGEGARNASKGEGVFNGTLVADRVVPQKSDVVNATREVEGGGYGYGVGGRGMNVMLSSWDPAGMTVDSPYMLGTPSGQAQVAPYMIFAVSSSSSSQELAIEVPTSPSATPGAIESSPTTTPNPPAVVNVDYYLTIYALIGLTTIIFILARLLILLDGTLRASRHIHTRLLDRVLNAPIRFFEVTPIGRIMNRFTKDIMSIDTAVGNGFGNMTYQMVYMVFVLGTVGGIVPGFLGALVPI